MNSLLKEEREKVLAETSRKLLAIRRQLDIEKKREKYKNNEEAREAIKKKNREHYHNVVKKRKLEQIDNAVSNLQ